MIFRVFDSCELASLYELAAANRVVGPVAKGRAADGSELIDFGYVNDYNELRLEYRNTVHSPKRFFLPHREELCTFSVCGRDWEKHVDPHVYQPTVFFGMHACDINALNKLEKVLSGSVYPDPFFAAKRRNMFIIGINCSRPLPSCFCRSMGTDTVLHGFGMFLTDLGDRYFAEILSSWAFELVKEINSREPDESDHERYRTVIAEKNRRFTARVDTSDLTKILDMEFQSGVWREWGDRCLACGTCASVCPTCYCYGVEERVDPDLAHAVKIRHLYSCNLIDFAEVAGGHNFRPERHVRLKYRFYHKHRGFVEAFEESLCVGCGRCGNACLAGITVPEVIASVRGGEHGEDAVC